MTSRAKKGLWVAIVIVAVGIACWVYLTRPFQFARQTAELPDGTRLELVSAAYGRTHVAPGGGWDRLLWLAPEWLTTKFGLKARAPYRTTNDTLVAWFKVNALGNFASSSLDFEAMDENGVAARANGPVRSTRLATGETIEGYEFPVFPRRQDEFVIRVRRSGYRAEGEARFAMANPAPDDFPAWTARETPVAGTDGDLEFTLERLAVRPGEGLQTEAEFTVKKDGRAVPHWFVEKIYLSDATGNQAQNHAWQTEEKDGRTLIRFDSPLFADGHPWKARVEFSRTFQGPFATNELLRFSGVPVPAKGDGGAGADSGQRPDELVLGRTNQVGSLAVILKSIEWESGGRSPQLEVRTKIPSESNESRLTMVTATDQEGRELKTSRRSWSGSGEYSYSIEPKESSETLDLVFALQKSRFVEYLATPRLEAPADKTDGAR